jgi:hypothetical protein
LRRAARVQPNELLQRYTTDRFVVAPMTPFAGLRRVEDALIAECAGAFEVVALAPLVPLGTHSAIATVDQNKVVSTSRLNEAAADPTNALALEAATRRNAELRRDAKSPTLVRLAASQRVVRAQQVSGPGICTFPAVRPGHRGPRRRQARFPKQPLRPGTWQYTRARAGLGADGVTISLTDLSETPRESRPRYARCRADRSGSLCRRRRAIERTRLLPNVLFQGAPRSAALHSKPATEVSWTGLNG